jgi:hypothetical protein
MHMNKILESNVERKKPCQTILKLINAFVERPNINFNDSTTLFTIRAWKYYNAIKSQASKQSH